MKKYSAVKFLNSGIKNFLQHSIPDKIYLLVQIRKEWTKIVGNSIAFHTSPYSLNNNQLTIHVDDPIWIQELNLRKDEMRESIIKHIGGDLSAMRIKFKNGEIIPFNQDSGEQGDSSMRLDKETLDKIDSHVSSIEDKKLREALRSYLIKSSLS